MPSGRPSLHPEQDAPDDGDSVQMVPVDCHLSGRARRQQIAREVVLDIDGGEGETSHFATIFGVEGG
jgi:hypothetical protein